MQTKPRPVPTSVDTLLILLRARLRELLERILRPREPARIPIPVVPARPTRRRR